MGYREEVLADAPVLFLPMDSGEALGSAVTTVTFNDTIQLEDSWDFGGGARHVSIDGLPTLSASGYTFGLWVKYPVDTPIANVDLVLRYTATNTTTSGSDPKLQIGGGSEVTTNVIGIDGQIIKHENSTNRTDLPDVSDGEWHYLAWTAPSTSARILYIDGVAYPNIPATYSGTFAGLLQLGWYNGTSSTYNFLGQMKGVEVYDTVLSPTRVTAHYEAMLSDDAPVDVPALEVLSGFANTLALTDAQGPTIALGAVVTPPVEVLAGLANVLSLQTLQGPTIVKGAVVMPPKALRTGVAGTLTLTELGATLDFAEPTPVGTMGEWFFEVTMAEKSMNTYNRTASLEVRNARKRVRTELKTLVRA